MLRAAAGHDPYDRDAADPGLTLFACTAEADSGHAEALNLLGSWAATPEPVGIAEASEDV